MLETVALAHKVMCRIIFLEVKYALWFRELGFDPYLVYHCFPVLEPWGTKYLYGKHLPKLFCRVFQFFGSTTGWRICEVEFRNIGCQVSEPRFSSSFCRSFVSVFYEQLIDQINLRDALERGYSMDNLLILREYWVFRKCNLIWFYHRVDVLLCFSIVCYCMQILKGICYFNNSV